MGNLVISFFFFIYVHRIQVPWSNFIEDPFCYFGRFFIHFFFYLAAGWIDLSAPLVSTYMLYIRKYALKSHTCDLRKIIVSCVTTHECYGAMKLQ